jgi:hypothetical protein
MSDIKNQKDQRKNSIYQEERISLKTHPPKEKIQKTIQQSSLKNQELYKKVEKEKSSNLYNTQNANIKFQDGRLDNLVNNFTVKKPELKRASLVPQTYNVNKLTEHEVLELKEKITSKSIKNQVKTKKLIKPDIKEKQGQILEKQKKVEENTSKKQSNLASLADSYQKSLEKFKQAQKKKQPNKQNQELAQVPLKKDVKQKTNQINKISWQLNKFSNISRLNISKDQLLKNSLSYNNHELKKSSIKLAGKEDFEYYDIDDNTLDSNQVNIVRKNQTQSLSTLEGVSFTKKVEKVAHHSRLNTATSNVSFAMNDPQKATIENLLKVRTSKRNIFPERFDDIGESFIDNNRINKVKHTKSNSLSQKISFKYNKNQQIHIENKIKTFLQIANSPALSNDLASLETYKESEVELKKAQDNILTSLKSATSPDQDRAHSIQLRKHNENLRRVTSVIKELESNTAPLINKYRQIKQELQGLLELDSVGFAKYISDYTNVNNKKEEMSINYLKNNYYPFSYYKQQYQSTDQAMIGVLQDLLEGYLSIKNQESYLSISGRKTSEGKLAAIIKLNNSSSFLESMGIIAPLEEQLCSDLKEITNNIPIKVNVENRVTQKSLNFSIDVKNLADLFKDLYEKNNQKGVKEFLQNKINSCKSLDNQQYIESLNNQLTKQSFEKKQANKLQQENDNIAIFDPLFKTNIDNKKISRNQSLSDALAKVLESKVGKYTTKVGASQQILVTGQLSFFQQVGYNEQIDDFINKIAAFDNGNIKIYNKFHKDGQIGFEVSYNNAHFAEFLDFLSEDPNAKNLYKINLLQDIACSVKDFIPNFESLIKNNGDAKILSDLSQKLLKKYFDTGDNIVKTSVAGNQVEVNVQLLDSDQFLREINASNIINNIKRILPNNVINQTEDNIISFKISYADMPHFIDSLPNKCKLQDLLIFNHKIDIKDRELPDLQNFDKFYDKSFLLQSQKIINQIGDDNLKQNSVQ